MADETTRPGRGPTRRRVNRHRAHLAPVVDAPPVAPVEAPAPVVPNQRAARPTRPTPPVAPVVDDRTPGALRRPAQISDRCAGCGAPTRGRTLMVTELVEVGPVRALRVVACSECSDRRRRELMT